MLFEICVISQIFNKFSLKNDLFKRKVEEKTFKTYIFFILSSFYMLKKKENMDGRTCTYLPSVEIDERSAMYLRSETLHMR